jgi:hypothetical protein
MIDVAVTARLSRSTVSRVEREEWDGVTFASIAAVADVLGTRLSVLVSWHGAALDRVLDEGHARLVAVVVARLDQWGWETRVEVSYSEWGERGSIDILAWHAKTATLLVIEVKTEVGSVEGLLRRLDVKIRLVAGIVRERFGWRAARVAAIVVFPESDAVRRQVARNAAVINNALPARSREVVAWLKSPVGAVRGCWFISDSRGAVPNPNPSSIQRVRQRETEATTPLRPQPRESAESQPKRPR